MIQVGSTIDFPLETLNTQISSRFRSFRVETMPATTDTAEAYDSYRNQHHSTRILALLERYIKGLGIDRLLGVAAFDLYVPGMNFVFGEARRPGRVAVISTHRLRQDSTNEIGLFEGRVAKEAVHEIGHMLGLKHCPDSFCVMHFSERLEDTDRKRADFCENCQLKIRRKEDGQEIQSET